MFYPYWIDSSLFTRRKVQMFRLEEPLVHGGLFRVFLDKCFFIWIFVEVLVQIFHHAVFYTLSIERKLLVHAFLVLWREDIVELFLHLVHQLLDVLPLLLAVDFRLDQLWKSGLNEWFYLLADGESNVTFQFVIEVVENTLLRCLLIRLPGSRSF